MFDLAGFQHGAVAAFALVESCCNPVLAIRTTPGRLRRTRTDTELFDLCDGTTQPIQAHGLKPRPAQTVLAVVKSTLQFVGFCFAEEKLSVAHTDIVYTLCRSCLLAKKEQAILKRVKEGHSLLLPVDQSSVYAYIFSHQTASTIYLVQVLHPPSR